MWSDEPNSALHPATDGLASSVTSRVLPTHPDHEIPQPLRNDHAILSPPSAASSHHSHPFPAAPPSPSSVPTAAPALRVSASVPALVAQAKTSPVLRSQSHSLDDDDLPDLASSKDNGNGLFTLPPPLATSQSLFTSPAGPRGAPVRVVPTLRAGAASSNSLKADEPLSYNRVHIHYAEHVASKEMTDTANLVRQALQLRRHFVFRPPRRPTEEFDIRVNPAFRHPSEDMPPATRHGYLMVEGVFVAWEGDMAEPPAVTEFFTNHISNPPSPASEPSRSASSSDTSSPSSSTARFFTCPSRSDYALALSLLMDIAVSGPLRSFCHNRLGLLQSRFSLHETLNGELENVAQRAVPHRDFYNVRKIDGHVHHSACMNQKHLLRFIKYKLKEAKDDPVIIRDGKALSLTQVFESLQLTPYDLSVDTLDMHANNQTFHRFDKFNLKYVRISSCTHLSPSSAHGLRSHPSFIACPIVLGTTPLENVGRPAPCCSCTMAA